MSDLAQEFFRQFDNLFPDKGQQSRAKYDVQLNELYRGKVSRYPGGAFYGFTLKGAEQLQPQIRSGSGFKMHFSVERKDIGKAYDIMLRISKKYGLPHFKIMTAARAGRQQGKTFTVYTDFKNRKTARLSAMVKEITAEFEKAHISVGKMGQNLRLGDQVIPGCPYGHYRFDSEEFATSRSHFSLPRGYEDPFEPLRWDNSANWRVGKNGYVLDSYSLLSESERFNLVTHLDDFGVPYRTGYTRAGKELLQLGLKSDQYLQNVLESSKGYSMEYIPSEKTTAVLRGLRADKIPFQTLKSDGGTYVRIANTAQAMSVLERNGIQPMFYQSHSWRNPQNWVSHTNNMTGIPTGNLNSYERSQLRAFFGMQNIEAQNGVVNLGSRAHPENVGALLVHANPAEVKRVLQTADRFVFLNVDPGLEKSMGNGRSLGAFQFYEEGGRQYLIAEKTNKMGLFLQKNNINPGFSVKKEGLWNRVKERFWGFEKAGTASKTAENTFENIEPQQVPQRKRATTPAENEASNTEANRGAEKRPDGVGENTKRVKVNTQENALAVQAELKKNGINSVRVKDSRGTYYVRVRAQDVDKAQSVIQEWKSARAVSGASNTGVNRGAESHVGELRMRADVRNIDNWRIMKGQFVYDNISVLSPEEQKRLFKFLEANNISYKTGNVTHRDGSRTTGIRIGQDSAELFKAKMAEVSEQARQTAKTKSATKSAETAEQARQTAETKSATKSAETAEQARQTAETKSATNPAEPRKMPVQSQLGSDVLRMKVNSLDDVLVLQEALSKRRIPSAYVRGDTAGHFLSVNAKDMDVLSEIAHERLGYSKAPVNGVRVASVATMSQAGIPEQAIKMSDMHVQSRKESVSAHGEIGKSTTGKIIGGTAKAGLSVLSATGTLAEFSAAQESFNSGKVGSGVYHSLSSVGMGAGTVAPFLKGPGGAIAGRIGTAGGSLMFGHDAVEDAQKGDYVSAGINAVGSASMAYETLAIASGSTVSLGTAVAAAPIAATAAAIGSSGAIGWSIGTWIAETYITPEMRYSMDRADAAALVQDRAKYTFKGAEFAYIDGFAEFFNDGFDLYTGGASWGAELNRVITSKESRKEELLEEIERDPQNAYNKGVAGYGSGDLAHANAFLIYEGLWKGAKPRGFESIPENGYQLNPAYPVKSDFSQIINMRVSNEYYVNENARAKTALMILGRNGGFSADDLAKAAREGSELLLNTMLLTVKDEKGNVRTLYDFNQEGKIEYTPMKQGEHSLFPDKMKTADNMNGVLREAVQTKNMSPFLFSVVQQALNGDGKFKISSDLLEKMLTKPKEVMEESLIGANATEIQEEKEAFMTVMCGNKDTGYLFHTWEITPQVIKAVQHLDDERKDAFFRYAIQNNLGKDNPEIQEALMSLMPQTTLTQQQPTEERAGSLTGTIGQSANHVHLENDQSGLQYAGHLNANERN